MFLSGRRMRDVVMRTYADLRPDDLASALDGALALADAELDLAVAAGRSNDTRELLTHLGLATRHARAAYGRSGVLRDVHPDPAIREAANVAQQRYESWQASVFGRRDLFAAVNRADETGLSPAERRHVDLWRATGRMNGAHLGPAAAEELKAARERATQLALEISDRFVAETPVMELTRDELAGLSPALLDTLEPGSTPGSLRLRVEFASRDDVLTGVRRRDIRERFWWLLNERSATTNLEPMRELFDVRRRIAHLAGFGSWAELRTSTAALRTVEAAHSTLDALAGPTHAAAEAFRLACEGAVADLTGDDGYQPWDQYLAVAQLGRGLGVDEESLRRFLPLSGVLEGLFRLSRDVYGIRVEERLEALGWHEDVRTLALIDDATGEQIGTCLFDPFARDGKLASTVAYMDLLDTPAAGPDGEQGPALTMLVTMFPKPVDGGPVSLSTSDVDSLFHEFGHVLDFTIGSRHQPVMDEGWWGTDWAEGPSLFMGWWGIAPAVLATYARDPVTGETIPSEAIDALATVQGLDKVPYLERYLGLGRLDLAVHGPEPVDLDEAWRAAWAPNPLPQPADHFQPFNMIMVVGGYDAALYGVPYAMLIRDALLDAFRREGWVNGETGRRYVRDVLRPGPFVAPRERLETFLGSELSSDALVDGMNGALRAAAGMTVTTAPH
jgi:Zn-dependent oligopeptidase